MPEPFHSPGCRDYTKCAQAQFTPCQHLFSLNLESLTMQLSLDFRQRDSNVAVARPRSLSTAHHRAFLYVA